jgi:Family of unknown function (DUF6247)
VTAAAAERGPQFPPDGEPVPPPPDPVAIRACLTPHVAAEFDAEWDIVLDKAKQSKDLAPVHALLHKWRHVAYSEMKDPGCYFRLLATAARTLATGEAPPGSVSGDEVKDLIRRRLGRSTRAGLAKSST